MVLQEYYIKILFLTGKTFKELKTNNNNKLKVITIFSKFLFFKLIY